MTFQKLTDKLLPTLILACVLATATAVMELKELSLKIDYIEQSISNYHNK